MKLEFTTSQVFRVTKLLKLYCGILFNLCGAYLLFYPQDFWVIYSKIVGIMGLFFSYWIFYQNIDGVVIE